MSRSTGATSRKREPERFDALEFLPGEEALVDYGQGAPTALGEGKYRRPHVFVMTLKSSGKSFRNTVCKTSQEVWAPARRNAPCTGRLPRLCRTRQPRGVSPFGICRPLAPAVMNISI